MKEKYSFIFLLLLSFFIPPLSGFSEGSKQLNLSGTNCLGNVSTTLYLCNNFTTHCSSSNGERTQFATYNATKSCESYERLYFVVQADEVVYFGFNGSPSSGSDSIVFRIQSEDNLGNIAIVYGEADLPHAGKEGFITNLTQACEGPAELITPPATGGYDAFLWTPPAPGLYFVEFSQRKEASPFNYSYSGFDIDLFDVTVYNTLTSNVIPGRLYCKSWQFSENNDFTGINYILSDDGIVTSVEFASMSGGTWVQYANQTGCGATNWTVSRQSLYNTQALFPQYKIFLNPPDPNIFTIATTSGQIVPPAPVGNRFCDGHIEFIVNVDRPGDVDIELSFSPTTFATTTRHGAVVTGANTIIWDGKDGNGVDVPNNIPITFTVTYVNGLTNLPLYDVEGNTSGFTVNLHSPPGNPPFVFWDDLNIWDEPACTGFTGTGGGLNNLAVQSNVGTAGCGYIPPAPPVACHAWPSTSCGWGNKNTVNTWWYTVSTSQTQPTINQWRAPLLPVFLTSNNAFCQNTSGHVFMVSTDINTDEFHWSYNPPSPNVIITHANPSDAFITVEFLNGAPSGSIEVYGTNSTCPDPGPTASYTITVNPFPAPLINGTNALCVGTTGLLYTTESGKSTYTWSISPGGIITGGGSGTDNTVTVNWVTAGPQFVSVNYTDPVTGCRPTSPTIYDVTVYARPNPTFLSGDLMACLHTPGHNYVTETTKLNYLWTISGGTITLGGDPGDNFAEVTWNTSGLNWIAVNYTDPVTQCNATIPTTYNVTVNNLPTPSIASGPISVCQNSAGNVYVTQSGKSNYAWNVTGGTLTAGGTATDNTITITWTTVGTGQVSINYTEPATQCVAATATVFDVEVKPLPIPVISGPLNACVNTPGNLYFTEAGKANYTWTVVGGTYTFPGPGQDQIDVTWTSTGVHSIAVIYMEPATQCYPSNPTVINVNVTLLPAPGISGSATVCEGVTITYSTEGFMQNYTWVVNGGTIQSGGTTSDNTVTVTWNTAGPQSVSVNYSLASGCTALAPTVVPITVHPRPAPAFSSGPVSVCQNVAGNVYTTALGKNSYLWNVTGGSITAGGTATDNSVIITWNTVGTGQVSLNYTEPSTNCAAINPTLLAVEVKPVPVPVITGPVNACVNTPGNIYATEAGKSNYTWLVTGGTYTYPGPGQDQINITWSTTGAHSLSVNYMEPATQCYATNPTGYSVTVHPLPTPTITGTNAICTGIATTYTTENIGQSYTWVISAGGSIQSGGSSTDNTVTVVWNTPGPQSVSVNYALASGCMALSPFLLPVTINQSTPPVVSASANPVCEGSAATYTTQAAMTNYVWAVPAGGAIQSGGGSGQNFVTVLWNTPNNQTINVHFTNQFGCTPPNPTPYPVNINPLPVTTIDGMVTVCQDYPTLYSYQTTVIDLQTTYTWQILTGSGSMNPSATANPVSISWTGTGTATLKVSATVNATGCNDSRTLDLAVNPKPAVALTACFDTYTNRSAKRFLLKGANPPYPQPVNPPQGEFIITPSTPALQYDAISGNYWFAPALVPGITTQTFSLSYRYTNRFGCPNTTLNAVQISVAGPNAGCGSTMTDPRDNKSYGTALLAGRCWMTENLNYRQGSSPNAIGTPMTDNCQPEKYCPPTDPTCATKEGAFYQWDELVQYLNTDGPAYQGLCPPGWHVPTETEWQSLIDNVDPTFSAPTANGIVGAYLKDTYKNFLALMTGVNYLNNTWAFATGTLTNTMFWSATPDGDNKAIARGLNDPYNPSISHYSSSRENAFPVRCVKD